MARTIGAPFWENPRDGLAIPGKDKIKEAKPLLADVVCSFFGAGTPESTRDSIISSIMIEVGEAGVLIPGRTLQRGSRKYLS